MKLPILEFYSDEGVINKESYINNVKEDFKNIELIEKYNINTALIIFIKEYKMPNELKKDLEEFYIFTSASNENKVYLYKKKFLVAISPLGEPASGALMEELGFMGISNFFACGSCGVVNHNFDASNLMLVERAIRDEGLSYKYQKPSIYTYTDEILTNKLSKFLEDNNFNYKKITTWTTDAFFRETPSSINKRVKQGAVCVEMECAGWCAIAKFRNYKFAQLLWSSDVTKQDGWGFKTKEERKQLKEKVIFLMLDFVLDFVKNK